MLGHTGDTHTKLSFPANDTIAFTTGYTERLRIDLRGNMGLGVNSIDNAESGNDTVFAIKGKGSSYAGRIEFQDSSGNKDGGIRVDSGILDLHADPDASTTNSMVRFIVDNSEKVRIISTGRVGIGSIIPQTTLDVYGEVTLPINNTLRWALGTTTKADMYSNSDGTLIFRTTGTERLRITSAGLVNIGGVAVSQSRTVNIGSNAEANLAIETHNDATSETANIRFYKSGNTGASPQVVETDDNIAQLIAYGHDGTDYANAAASIKMSVDGAPGGNDMPGKIIFSTNAGGTSTTERLRIDSNGRLLLGAGAISLPKGSGAGSFDLDNGSITMCIGGNVNSTGRTNSTDKINRISSPHYTNAEEPVMLISSYNQSGSNGITYGGGSSLTNAVTQHAFYTAANTTTTNGSERMRITPYGDVGISSATPSDPSWGTEGNTKFLSIKGTTYGCLSLEGSNGAYTKWTMGAGDSRLYMGYSENTATHLLDLVNGTNAVEVMAGNLVMRAADKGIDFTGGSSIGTAANILHDYEEGTFTPHLQGYYNSAWTNVTFSSVSRYGRYVKVGNLVHVQIYFSNFHIDSEFDSTLARLGNLPYSAGPSDNTGYGLLSYAHGTAFEQAGHFFYTNAGYNTAASVREDNTNYNTWSGSSGRYLMASGTYTTA